MKILAELFKGTASLAPISPLMVGNSVNGLYKSTARAATTPRSEVVKISNVALALRKILMKKVAITEMASSPGVYVEYYSESSKSPFDEPSTYLRLNGPSSIFCNKEEEEVSIAAKVSVALAYALSSHTEMKCTKELFEKCVDCYNATGEVSNPLLFEFCDAFYYEWLTEQSQELSVNSGINHLIIKQAVRTGEIVPVPAVNNSDCPQPELFIESLVVEKEESKVTKSEDQYHDCKTGAYILDTCWDLDQMSHIPSLDVLDGYVPSSQFFTLVDLLHSELSEVEARLKAGEYGVNAIKNNYVNTILVGKPGTGKTTLANALAATFGMPLRTVTVSKNTEEDLYQGMTKVSEGGFKFVETPFLDVYKNGGIILLEEFNLSDPAVMMGALGQAIEKPFILYEDGYKEIRRHPLCVIISTMNTATQGSREPSEAFTSRSADVFMLDDPDKDQFINILNKNGYDMKSCKKVYTAYTKIITYLTSSTVNAEDVALSITLRHCLAALRQMKIGRPFKEALKNTMIGSIAIKDLTLAQTVYNSVVEPMA